MKTPQAEFDKFKAMIEEEVPFCFCRYSDGELFIMQNKEVKLAPDHFITGKTGGYCTYAPEDQKHFDPVANPGLREDLIETFKYKADNYFKGICTRSDVSEEDFQFQIDLHQGEDDSLTFSNLFINANYPRYINEIIPLFKDRNIVIVTNELSDISGLPFKVKKDFRVGTNCIVNDVDLPQKVAQYMKDKKGWILLSSAASLSESILYETFKLNNKNTCLDIGSSLNPYMKLEGWKYSRGYLQMYWLGMNNRYGRQVDTW